MARLLPLRGVIEGFYGTPWTHESRLATIEFLGQHRMNAYVYAPKDDPLHRSAWREPYGPESAAHFADLVAAGISAGVEIGWALSPGLDIGYSSKVDREALLKKIATVQELGVEWIVLALDDIPMREGLAEEQADLTSWLVAQLGSSRVTLVPTDYIGTLPTAYLSRLASDLPAEVDVMWTGPTVCSPTITAADAQSWATALGGRRPFVWDNYPVNDGTMSTALHLGPYRGREADLTDEVDAILLNPMTQARASWVALATAAEYFDDPVAYEPAPAWERALDEVGGLHARGLRSLSMACADSPISRPNQIPLAVLIESLEESNDTDNRNAIRASLREAKTAVLEWSDPGELHDEVSPWLAAVATAAATGNAAIKLLGRLAEVSATPSREETEALLAHAFALLFYWSGIRETKETVYGPRFIIYPAIVSRYDGATVLDLSEALRENANAIDRLCRFALDCYGKWADTPILARSDGGTL